MSTRHAARFATVAVALAAALAVPAQAQTEDPANAPGTGERSAASTEVRDLLGADLADAIAAASRISVMGLSGVATDGQEAVAGLRVRETQVLGEADLERARSALFDPATVAKVLDPATAEGFPFTWAIRLEADGAEPVTLVIGYPIGADGGRMRWVEGGRVFALRRGPLQDFLGAIIRS